MEGVRRATARAPQARAAVRAFGAGEHIGGAESLSDVGARDARGEISHQEIFFADELMAGIELAGRGDREILRTRAAARKPLVNTRSVFKIEHVVVEHERCTFLSFLDHALGEELVLAHDDREILFGQRVGRVRRADDGFHAQPVEAEGEHGVDILHEIGIEVSEGAADIVFFSDGFARGLQGEEFGDDDLEAPYAPHGLAEAVVDFLSAVEAHHDIVHLAGGEVDDFLVHEHTVCGEGETEVLARLLFALSAVGDEAFHRLPIHERFAAEKVNFEVVSVARRLDEEVEGAAARLVGHERAFAVVAPLAREAVLAVEVAGVRDMEAERFEDAGALCGRDEIARKSLLCKKFAGCCQFVYLGEALDRFALRQTVFFAQHRGELFAGGRRVEVYRVADGLVHDMYRPRLAVDGEIHPGIKKSMDHNQSHPSTLGRLQCRKREELLRVILALLVGDAAGSLASGLAGGLAFAAAAVQLALFKVAGVQGDYSLHG